MGAVWVVVLPEILNVSADAYVMMREKGIEGWPYQRPLPSGPITRSGGFIVACVFALQDEFGPKPIAWAELYASVDILVGSKPPTLAGFGRAGGSLNLGPFSLGVQAQVAFILAQEQKYFWAEVTGKIELLFFDIEGTVTISFGQEPTLSLPDPDRHPLDLLDANGNRVGSGFADGRYLPGHGEIGRKPLPEHRRYVCLARRYHLPAVRHFAESGGDGAGAVSDACR